MSHAVNLLNTSLVRSSSLPKHSSPVNKEEVATNFENTQNGSSQKVGNRWYSVLDSNTLKSQWVRFQTEIQSRNQPGEPSSHERK